MKKIKIKNIKTCFLLLAILVIVGCAAYTAYFLLNLPYYLLNLQYTFEKGFNEMLKLDKKYNTSFYTEALDVENRFSDYKIYDFDWNRTIVSIEKIDMMIADLKEMRDNVNKTKKSDNAQIVMLMIDSRIKMLGSEKLYQLGMSIGDKGDAYGGFRCGEKPYILNLSRLFNESTIIGQEATRAWDELLTYYPKTRPLLSKDKRPKFYDSPFWPIRKYATGNVIIVNELCPE